MAGNAVTGSTRGVWAIISGAPPTAGGLAGAIILATEGRIVGVAFVLLLAAIHLYASHLVSRRPPLSLDQMADWTGIRAMTTFSCLLLPFYLALTMS
jgi:hypothetical protein